MLRSGLATMVRHPLERPRPLPQRSAGILLFREDGRGLELFLVHMGGPFWRAKDSGAWTIPKGLVEPGEDPEAAARREFEEETGLALPEGPLLPLPPLRLSGGKLLEALALRGEVDATSLASNLFTLEWPPRSGRMASFPEADRADWFAPAAAEQKLTR